MRSLNELIDASEPALPLVLEWIKTAQCPVEVLPCTPEAGNQSLLAVQVTTRSPMGAICHKTGGILVDDGWLRILGAGHARLTRSLAEWNHGKFPTNAQGSPGALLVADDAIGGFFALNGGAIEGVAPGKIAYFAPDRLAWEGTNLGYSDFLTWAWSGRLERFYADQRWPGWPDEIRPLHGDQAMLIYPFLSAEGPPIAERSRKPIPITEAFHLVFDIRRQLS